MRSDEYLVQIIDGDSGAIAVVPPEGTPLLAEDGTTLQSESGETLYAE